MSGGSMDYFYAHLQDYAHSLHDYELDEMMDDLCDLYYAREWYDSGDTSEGDWLEALKHFKGKWLGLSTNKRVDRIVDKIRNELEISLGVYKSCGQCKEWKRHDKKGSDYGNCVHCRGYSKHKGEIACEKFVDKTEG